MNTQNPTTALDRIVERYEQRIETVRRIQAIIAEDGTLVQDLIEALSHSGSVDASRSATLSKDSSTTQSDVVVSYLKAQGKAWSTAPQIMKATGLARGAVSHVLYKSLRGRLEKRRHGSNAKLRLWRLKGSSQDD